MISQMRRNGLILAGFAITAIVLVMSTQWLTKERIEVQQRNELMLTLNTLIPADQYNNDLYADCTMVTAPDVLGLSQPQPVYRGRLDGEPTAMAIRTTAPDGYSGNIHLLVAIDIEGTVQGVRVLSHRETPGLGDKIEIRRDDWILSFDGQRVRDENDSRWAVQRDGGMFDAFAGATITPRAIVNAVERTVRYAMHNQNDLFDAAANCSPDQATPAHPGDETDPSAPMPSSSIQGDQP